MIHQSGRSLPLIRLRLACTVTVRFNILVGPQRDGDAMKPLIIIQIAVNCILAFVPLLLIFNMHWIADSLPIVIASPILWIGSTILCYRSSGRNKWMLWLLVLAPIAFGPTVFELLLIFGFSRGGI
jgi:hypothetical protein